MRAELSGTIEVAPRLNSFTLRFQPQLESAYTEDVRERSRGVHRRGGLLSAIPCGIFAVAIYSIPEIPADLSVLAALWLCAALGFAQVAITFSKTLERFLEPLVTVGGMLFAAGIGYVCWRLPDAWLAAGFGMMLLSVMLGYALYGLYGIRYLYSLAQGLAVTGAFVVVILERGIYPTVYGPPLAALGYFAVINAVGVAFAYSRDRQMRENYLLERRVDEKQRTTDALLRSILPQGIADRLQRGEVTIADDHAEVSVLFADVKGFTALAARRPAREVVQLLDRLFSAFDKICLEEGIEKIKTIGDAYMAAAGVPQGCEDHADRALRAAIRMQRTARAIDANADAALSLRIGIHSGGVVAGVIGTTKFTYDLWGDTVNVASRMESSAEPDTIQVSFATRMRLFHDYDFWQPRAVHPRGTGPMRAFVLREPYDRQVAA